MSALLELLMWLVVFGVVALVVVAVRRTSRLGRAGHGVSSGVANWLADINAMLQPQRPTAEVITQAKDGEEEHDDEGDDKEPGRRVKPGPGAAPGD
jgi:hypothetical protein